MFSLPFGVKNIESIFFYTSQNKILNNFVWVVRKNQLRKKNRKSHHQKLVLTWKSQRYPVILERKFILLKCPTFYQLRRSLLNRKLMKMKLMKKRR